jgi:hypothetical protein
MDQKRTLDELCAIYALEPGVRDIFVEGRSDQLFVEWYLRTNGVTIVSVYSIDLIDVPDDVLAVHNVSAGSNRSRIVALACELSKRCPDGLKVLCLADRDFEDYRPSASTSTYLLFTDCNSMDLYPFTAATMDKFCAVALGGFPLGCDELVRSLTAILERLFAYRLANELLGWSMGWIPFGRYVEIRKGTITFKADGFLRAYLQKNRRWRERKIFDTEVNRVVARLSQDTRRRVRGHDFSELLLHMIRHLRTERKYGNTETLEGALRASLECADLREEPCFQRILDMGASV